jgi:hypothetical protein
MNAPAVELQKAIFTALKQDSVLSGLLGGDKIFDQVPPKASFPYVSFGRTSLYDWSTGTESGTEQLFTLHIWSRATGKKEALDIMEACKACLHADGLTLEGHHLVNMQLEFAEARYDENLLVHHGLLRFRAVTEPAA